MAITGLMAGANEQRGADTNYLAALDQMRRAQVAQALEQARLQQQQQQFGQDFALRQAQQAQQNDLERQRLAMQQSQFGQEFGLRQSADQRAAEQARLQGLSSQFELGQKQQTLGARNALADLIAQNPNMGAKDLGVAILQKGGDISSGLGFLKVAQEEEAAKRKEAQQAQQAARGEWKILAEQGIRVNTTTGEVQPLNVPAGAGKPLTEAQANAAGYGMRAAQAANILEGLQNKGVYTGSLIKQGVENLPGVGGMLGMAANVLVASPEQQQVEQAQRNFVNAVLRRESGAAISPSEFESAKKQYFPQPGNPPEVIAQKLQNMQTTIDALRLGAGHGAGNIPAYTPGQTSWDKQYQSKAQAVQDALQAIQQGAPRDAVRQRLKDIGISDARI
jgi:hypothetical protein